MKRSILIVIIAMLGLVAPVVRAAESDAEWVKQAEAQLASGDFTAALASYAAAVKADATNDELKQEYAVLRQVIRIRDMHAAEEDAKRKQQMAAALRSFYYDHALYGDALTLDTQTHTDVQDAGTAANLAESHLELNQNAEVVKLLSELPEKQQTARTRTLLAIALLREGNTEDAEALAGKVQKPEQDDPGLYFELACMYSLLGDVDRSSEMLTQSFQATRPSLLEKAHARALARADLKQLKDTGGSPSPRAAAHQAAPGAPARAIATAVAVPATRSNPDNRS